MRRLILAVVCFTFLLTATASAQVYRWGEFFDGLGGEAFEIASPTQVELGLEGVAEIDAGNAAIYIRTLAGNEYALGDNGNGELGNGSTESSATPVKVHFPEGDLITAIGEADNSAYAITTGGAFAWGSNENSHLCTGKTGGERIPTSVPIENAVAVQGGAGHVTWLLSNGHVETCGQNSGGQLGLGEGVKIAKTPTEVKGLSEIVQISTGVTAAGALTASGELFMWGKNENGEVCNGTETTVFVPVKVAEGVSSFSEGGMAAGDGHTLALKGGKLYGCGTNNDAEAVPGDATKASVLTLTASGFSYESVVASGKYSLGLKEGNVFAWGDGTDDELGTGNTKTQLSPAEVLSGAEVISATARDSVAIG